MEEPNPNVIRLSSDDNEKVRLDAEKRIKESGARLLRTRKRLREYIEN